MSNSNASVTPTSDFIAHSPKGRREQDERRLSRQQAREQKQLEIRDGHEYAALGNVGFPIDLIDEQSSDVWEPIGKKRCKYGADCYQGSEFHKQNFSHPKHESLHEERTETMSQEARRLPLTKTKDDRDAIVADDASLSVGEGSEEEAEYLGEETSEEESVGASPGNGSESSEWDISTLSKEFKAEGLHGELAKLCAAIKKARRVLAKENEAQLVVREETRKMQMQAQDKMLAMWKKMDADMQACSRQARKCFRATKQLYTTTTTTMNDTIFKEQTSQKTRKRSSKTTSKSTRKSSTRKLTQQTLTQQDNDVFGPHGKRERDAKRDANDSSSSSGDDSWTRGKMAKRKEKN